MCLSLIKLALLVPYTEDITAQNYSYNAFNGNSYDLAPFEGNNVVVLVPPESPSSIDSSTIKQLVKICDNLYLFYATGLGFEPPGGNVDFDQKSNVAFVSETCGGGCGLVGAKGIEIGEAFFEPIISEIRDTLNSSEIDVIAYEFGRNFFIYSSKILVPGPYEPNGQNGGFAEGFANLLGLKALKVAYPEKNRFLNENAYYEKELYRVGMAYIGNQGVTPDSVLFKKGVFVDKNRNKRGLYNPAGFPASGLTR